MQEAPKYSSFLSKIRWIRANHTDSRESERVLHQLSGYVLKSGMTKLRICRTNLRHYVLYMVLRIIFFACRANLRCEDVCINEQGHYLHTVVGGPKESSPTQGTDEAMAMVCIPGYGAGSGFFFRIFKGLASAWRLYAVRTYSLA